MIGNIENMWEMDKDGKDGEVGWVWPRDADASNDFCALPGEAGLLLTYPLRRLLLLEAAAHVHPTLVRRRRPGSDARYWVSTAWGNEPPHTESAVTANASNTTNAAAAAAAA